jgi:hypothetical protein
VQDARRLATSVIDVDIVRLMPQQGPEFALQWLDVEAVPILLLKVARDRDGERVAGADGDVETFREIAKCGPENDFLTALCPQVEQLRITDNRDAGHRGELPGLSFRPQHDRDDNAADGEGET